MWFKTYIIANLICVISLTLFVVNDWTSWVYFFLFGLVSFLVLLLGILNLDWQFFFKSLSRIDNNSNEIFLTFDDGPNENFTIHILKLLEKYQAKATFFCIGKNLENYPDIFNEIIIKGHSVGNHSYTHSSNIDFNSSKAWENELMATDLLIEKYLLKKNNLFRPPYGISTPHLAKALRQTKHKVIGWSIRTFDTAQKNPDKISQKILKNVKSGDIILMHDSQEIAYEVLKVILPILKERNFTFASINNE